MKYWSNFILAGIWRIWYIGFNLTVWVQLFQVPLPSFYFPFFPSSLPVMYKSFQAETKVLTHETEASGSWSEAGPVAQKLYYPITQQIEAYITF